MQSYIKKLFFNTYLKFSFYTCFYSLSKGVQSYGNFIIRIFFCVKFY